MAILRSDSLFSKQLFQIKSRSSVFLLPFILVTLYSCAGTSAPEASPAIEGVIRTGRQIAPPPGAYNPKKDRDAADMLLEQFPESARDSDSIVSIPMDSSSLPGSPQASAVDRKRDLKARRTDSEVVGNQKNLSDRYATDLGEIDRDLGVLPQEANQSAPSFTLGVQKIKGLFKEGNHEDALLETNELLRYYPKAPQLLLMKGTLHQKLGQVDLALTAYERAFEYEPSRKLKAQIDYLKRQIGERETMKKPIEGIVIPQGVQEIRPVPASPKPNASGTKKSPNNDGEEDQ